MKGTKVEALSGTLGWRHLMVPQGWRHLMVPQGWRHLTHIIQKDLTKNASGKITDHYDLP